MAKINWNNQTTSLFTWTSAMDCWSFSLPAGKDGACPMAIENDPQSICSKCYAMTGRYVFSNIIKSQYIRFGWVKESLLNKTFINDMTNKIGALTPNAYFRWHDSGDLFSLEYLQAVTQICNNLPHIKFWVPTRAWRFPHWKSALSRLDSLSNVVVRYSALYTNDHSPFVSSCGSTVIDDISKLPPIHTICPKTLNHSSCGKENCRSCWDKNSNKIAYLEHGYAVTQRIKNVRKDIMTKLTIKQTI